VEVFNDQPVQSEPREGGAFHSNVPAPSGDSEEQEPDGLLAVLSRSPCVPTRPPEIAAFESLAEIPKGLQLCARERILRVSAVRGRRQAILDHFQLGHFPWIQEPCERACSGQ
jgi:hypothetical protein